jgi:hypothetical protein
MTKKYGIDLDDANNEVYEAAREFTEQQQEAAEPVTSEDIKFVIEIMKNNDEQDLRLKITHLNLLSVKSYRIKVKGMWEVDKQ